MIRSMWRIALVGAVLSSASVLADAPDPNPGRFAKDIETFEIWDRKNSFPSNAILFVGSSSIRLWPTANTFPGNPIINRGFGGSEISDVIHYYNQVVRPYEPSVIILYAGDNDIAGGKGAEQVLRDFKAFADRVQTEMPETRLLFISIKPSVARWDKWPTMVDANNLVREYATEHPNLGYVDLATPLLNEDGDPKDVFVDDGLHLNERGYFLWQQALAPYLK
jgi:lysophospholipase L1-like esterase